MRCNRESFRKIFSYVIACPLSNCLYPRCISLTFPSHFWWHTSVHTGRGVRCVIWLASVNSIVQFLWSENSTDLWLKKKPFLTWSPYADIQESSYDIKIYKTYQVMEFVFCVFIKNASGFRFHSLIVCPWQQMGFFLTNCWLCRNSPDAIRCILPSIAFHRSILLIYN